MSKARGQTLSRKRRRELIYGSGHPLKVRNNRKITRGRRSTHQYVSKPHGKLIFHSN